MKNTDNNINVYNSAENIKEKKIFIYFKNLRTRLTIGLLFVFIIPYLFLSIYFHIQFNKSLINTGKINLESLTESNMNTIELFLQERVVNLFRLFYSGKFNTPPATNNLEYLLDNLRRSNDSFIDLGFLTEEGLQKEYVGPFGYLQNKDYSKEKWFSALIASEKNYYISDVYLGFRNKPHFTIAVKQNINGKTHIIRSTLDPDKLYIYLRTISKGKPVEAAIINNEGIYQVVDPNAGNLLEKSDYIPSKNNIIGTDLIKIDKEKFFISYSKLDEVPWALILKQPLSKVYRQMYGARTIIISVSLLLIITISIVIWFAVKKLMERAYENAKKSGELWEQLRHASKLASLGTLATGIAHEINNPLAIIVATTGVIKDMLNPEFKMDDSPEKILEELQVIDNAALRAKGITRQLLDYGRKNKPSVKLTNINKLLEETLSGLKERELKVENIELKKEFDKNLPYIEVDPDQIRQVFLNFINNAEQAIKPPGSITITTGHDDKAVSVTVTDTGAGMSREQINNIFEPFFTTKEVGKGTGLGLSVSHNIVKSMGGEITVQSIPGRGSSFTVTLPISTMKKGEDNGSS